ncbi:hypothetical protein KY290_032025 [Solanum tuberosum]|uniref:Uncharacterized protein n=1 Tax=Solanum tuberosum TaxID=4113 RepID=A0ABQ7UCQ8_SOLTU|nr:hypothetical protein KY290_032025 [Solanum tuberosum]
MDAGQTSKRPNSDKKDDDRNVRRRELYKLMMANEKRTINMKNSCSTSRIVTELPLFPAFDNGNPHSIYEKVNYVICSAFCPCFEITVAKRAWAS